MAAKADGNYELMTKQFGVDGLLKKPAAALEVVYRPVPFSEPGDIDRRGPVWQVRFDLVHDSSRCVGLEVNGEVELGRDQEGPGFVSLNDYDGEALGVSRRHALLRSTETHLYILDLGSTNGTWQNGHSIGVQMPYQLTNGDLLRFGRLEFMVKIVQRPVGHAGALSPKGRWAKAVVSVAQAITSQLDFDEVLQQALEIAVTCAAADEASVWLLDEQTGELFLEASRGIQDERIQRMRLPVIDTLPGKAIEAGKPLYFNNVPGGEKLKVKTGYLVEAVIYLPLILGGVTFGVLSAAHRKPGSLFTPEDESLLSAVADLMAVAVQNSRLHQAVTDNLSSQTKLVTSLHYALSCELKNMANATIGYADLLSSEENLNEYGLEIVQRIGAAGNQMVELISRLLEVSTLNEGDVHPYASCDLVEIVRRAVRDMVGAAGQKAVTIDLAIVSEGYLIRGDAPRLYRCIRALLTNALIASPSGTSVRVELEFRKKDLRLRVRDAGPAIAADDLAHVFDQYARSGQTSEGQADIELGLALVRATVEAHRGTVTAHNLDGRGVEFTVKLPATLRLAAADDLPPAPAAGRP